MDYVIEKVSCYDGTGRKENAIIVFNCSTGVEVACVRRRPFESKAAWIARAMAPYDRKAA